MTKPAAFRQADLTRAIKAMEKAGVRVCGATIRPDGTITLLTGDKEVANDWRNPLDRVLLQ